LQDNTIANSEHSLIGELQGRLSYSCRRKDNQEKGRIAHGIDQSERRVYFHTRTPVIDNDWNSEAAHEPHNRVADGGTMNADQIRNEEDRNDILRGRQATGNRVCEG
jgi:hypothetical protein